MGVAVQPEAAGVVDGWAATVGASSGSLAEAPTAVTHTNDNPTMMVAIRLTM